MNHHVGLDYSTDPLTSNPPPPAMTLSPNTNQQILAQSSLPRKFESLQGAMPLAGAPDLNSKDPLSSNIYSDVNNQHSPTASPLPRHVGQMSPIGPHDTRNDPLSSRAYHPVGPSPSIPISGGNNIRGFSIVNMLPGYRDSISGFRDSFSAYRENSAGHRDSIGGLPMFDANGRLRGDSISLPPPMYKGNEQDLSNSHSSLKSASWGHEPLRSTSIFSSLIQIPPSANNSISGQSSKDGNRFLMLLEGKRPLVPLYENDLPRKDSNGSFSWHPDYKQGSSSIPGSRRGTKAFENSLAVWDQLNRGMAGSIASINNDNLNQFLASMQNSGSVDLLTTLRAEDHGSNNASQPSGIVSQPPELGPRPPLSSFPGTSLREDIFEDKSKLSKQNRNNSVSGDKPLSPTSSLSSKTSKRTYDEPQSPKAFFKRGSDTRDSFSSQPLTVLHGSPLNNLQHFANGDLSGNGGSYDRVSNNGANMALSYKDAIAKNPASDVDQNDLMSMEALPNGAPMLTEGKQHLVPAQQYATSEDGRPLLGATKVDQLMLVIQAREKGNTTAIRQAADGSILANPEPGSEPLLPAPVDLVGGLEKPTREDQESNRKRRRGKKQQCPYCSKTFNQTTHLDVHVRSHIGYKPFQCSVCSKRFTQGGNLRTHMRLHTGEKPFSCEICERSFSRKGNLAAHMLTHNKEKPFQCRLDNCDRSFTQLGNLKSHQNKFHLPTLTSLTQKLANITGDALAQLPKEEKELLDYFAKLYKNSNKGIRGRGKGKAVLKLNEGSGDSQTPMTLKDDDPASYHSENNEDMNHTYDES